MKLTKCFLVASAAFMAGSLMHNVSNHKNDVYHADVLDADVQQLMGQLKNHQGETHLNNFANFYFSNLRNNFSLNAFGTCSYVSMGMLLSYYDTYFNDDFVPEYFDQNTVVEQSANGAIITKGVESPGVVPEDYDFITSLSNFSNYVSNNPTASFQNYLINYAANTVNSTALDGFNLGLSVDQQVAVLNEYLSDHVGSGYTAQSYVAWPNESQVSIKESIKPYLDRGEAVILNIRSAQVGCHSVVAYDYDDTDIYVHTGWKDADGNAITHVALHDLDHGVYFGMTGGVSIKSYVRINLPEYNVMTGYQNNYVTANGNAVSLKTLLAPYDVKLEYNPETPEVIPVLSWKSLKDEIWFGANSHVTFQVKIRDAETDEIIQSNITGDTNVFLNSSTVERITNQYGMIDFNLEIKTTYSDSILHERATYNQTTRITDTQDYQRINPSDYGFPRRSNSYAANFVDVATQNGFGFKVRKTPNVYTANSGRILFATNIKNYTGAYLEYNFLQPITEIKMSVNENDGDTSFMSASAYNLAKGALHVQGFKNGQYFPEIESVSQTARHLNNLITGHEVAFTRASAIITYRFAEPVYRVRICTSAAANGRIGKVGITHIFNMFLEEVFVKPVQGEFLPGNGSEFHMGEVPEGHYYSDYAYALSLDEDAVGIGYQPGEDTHEDYDDYAYEPEYYDIDVITEMAEADAAPGGLTTAGYTFEQIGKYDMADDGCYKVALVIVAPEDDLSNTDINDYKFARQNSDGTWSFVSRGLNSGVVNVDANNDIIYDPANLSYWLNHRKYVVRSASDIRFFQVSREKGDLGAEEDGEYFPPHDMLNNGTHDLTKDEEYYVIKPPFTPIFTGEF